MAQHWNLDARFKKHVACHAILQFNGCPEAQKTRSLRIPCVPWGIQNPKIPWVPWGNFNIRAKSCNGKIQWLPLRHENTAIIQFVCCPEAFKDFVVWEFSRCREAFKIHAACNCWNELVSHVLLETIGRKIKVYTVYIYIVYMYSIYIVYIYSIYLYI